MKYFNRIIVNIALLLLVKMFFFDKYISLGVIDKHYGVICFVLLIMIIGSEFYLRKKNKEK